MDEARRLAEGRQRAREVKDFVLADELRDRIREGGFELRDTPAGPELRPIQAETHVYRRSLDVPDALAAPLTHEFSVHWIVEGWPEDVERGIASFRRHESRTVQHVVVDAAGLNRSWPEAVEVIRIDPGCGWAAARNAGLRRASGTIVMVVDGSIEATGDVFVPLEAALRDETVGVTGPFGIISEEMRHFHDSPGPEVDAVQAYLMAFNRELLAKGLRFDEKFKFYRTCDIELSFQVKAMGLRATVTTVPVTKHEHRMWTSTSEEERAGLSKKNFYRFLNKWRDRTDLLVSAR